MWLVHSDPPDDYKNPGDDDDDDIYIFCVCIFNMRKVSPKRFINISSLNANFIAKTLTCILKSDIVKRKYFNKVNVLNFYQLTFYSNLILQIKKCLY